jgi:hypothetical protein
MDDEELNKEIPLIVTMLVENKANNNNFKFIEKEKILEVSKLENKFISRSLLLYYVLLINVKEQIYESKIFEKLNIIEIINWSQQNKKLLGNIIHLIIIQDHFIVNLFQL